MKKLLKALASALLLFAVVLIAIPAKADQVKITLSAAGDCTLGSDDRFNTNFFTYYNNNGSKYFLKKVKSVFTEDDVTIVNLEGTFTPSKNRRQKTFTFRAPKKYVHILNEGNVEVVNIANNHTYDYNVKGFNDTKKTLEAADIAYCGYGNIAYKDVKGVKMAFLGYNALEGVSGKTVKNDIKKAKQNGAVITVVSFHWGIEREYAFNSNQKKLAHAAIDGGADLVLGHHPHVLQGIEKYKGKYICYSLGNFCFGGNSNPSDKDTMIFRQQFTVNNGVVESDAKYRIIPCSLSGKKTSNNFQPVILKGSEKNRVLKKIKKMSRNL